MITTITVDNLPSLANFPPHLRWQKFPYQLFRYLFASNSDGTEVVFFTRLQMVKKLIEHGNQPFYGADLFGASASLGGRIGGLSYGGIIKETGNCREVMVPSGRDLYKKSSVYEWELAVPVEELSAALNEIMDELVKGLLS